MRRTRPIFQYTAVTQQAILKPLEPLLRDVEPSDVVDSVTKEAARAMLNDRRRPFAGETEKMLKKLRTTAMTLRDLIDSLNPLLHEEIDRQMQSALSLKREFRDIDLDGMSNLLQEFAATTANAAERIVPTLPRTGRPFDEARFQFGIALYEIFEKATGRRPSGATPTDSWEEGGAFFRFVEEAIVPTQLLGDAGVKSLVEDVIVWARTRELSQRKEQAIGD